MRTRLFSLFHFLLLLSACSKEEEPSDVTIVELSIVGEQGSEHLIEVYKTFWTISLTTEFRKIDEFKFRDGWTYMYEFEHHLEDNYKLSYKSTEGTNEKCLMPQEVQLKEGCRNEVKFNNECE